MIDLGDILAGIGVIALIVKILMHWYLMKKIDPDFVPAFGGNLMPGEYFFPFRYSVPSSLLSKKKLCNIFFWVSFLSFASLFIHLFSKLFK